MTSSDIPESARPERERARTRHWVRSAGAQLLVVDPLPDDCGFDADMSARGVHVTRVGSTIDALIEFGRRNPEAVIVSPRAVGLSVAEFVCKLMEYGSPTVLGVVETGESGLDGSLVLPGVSTVVGRPYTAERVWNLLQQSAHALDHHAHLSYGPIVLDAAAYTVHIHEERVPSFPLKEFQLLRALMYRAPEVLTNEDLRAEVWGGPNDRASDATIRVHVRRLRARLDGVAEVRRVNRRGYALSID